MQETPPIEGPKHNGSEGAEAPDPEIERFHDEGGPVPPEPEEAPDEPEEPQVPGEPAGPEQS